MAIRKQINALSRIQDVENNQQRAVLNQPTTEKQHRLHQQLVCDQQVQDQLIEGTVKVRENL